MFAKCELIQGCFRLFNPLIVCTPILNHRITFEHVNNNARTHIILVINRHGNDTTDRSGMKGKSGQNVLNSKDEGSSLTKLHRFIWIINAQIGEAKCIDLFFSTHSMRTVIYLIQLTCPCVENVPLFA